MHRPIGRYRRIGSHLHPLDLTSFAACLLPVATAVFFVQQWCKIRFGASVSRVSRVIMPTPAAGGALSDTAIHPSVCPTAQLP